MPVSDQDPRVQYTAPGGSADYATTFPFFDEGDLVVITTEGGVSTTRALGSDYTVTGGGIVDGTVQDGTVTASFNAAAIVTIYRDVAMDQEAEFEDGDSLPAGVLNKVIDKLTMLIQQNAATIARALLLDPASTITGIIFPPNVANKLLGWNNAGDALENKDSGALGVLVKASIAEVRAASDDADYVTARGLAALWQRGSNLTSAASIAKPADANLGGYYVQSGSTGTDSYWAGSVDGEEMEIRYTAAVTLSVAGNLVPPGGGAFDVTAGGFVRWRWDASASKWRAVEWTSPRGRFKTASIADDGVFSFTPPLSAGEISLLTPGFALAFQGKAIYLAAASGAGMVAGAVGANFTVVTTAGTLTGTSGSEPDGNVCIRANTDGKIYVSNRTGSARTFTYEITQ
jgi:hypothetical protein